MNTPETTPLVTPQLLRYLRNKAGLTQSELAERMGVSQAVLSRYESGDVAIPLEAAVKLIDQLGLGVQMMVDEPKRGFSPVGLGDPYRDYCARLRFLREFIRGESPQNHAGTDLNSPQALDVLVKSLLQLPRVVIAGRYDAGKSHVSNCLLGGGVLPTDYTPLTRIPIAVVHRDYRPPFVTADCAMMKGSFDLTILLDESKFREQAVQMGGRELLSSGAIHTTEDQEPGNTDWAVVFLDSDILRACVLVDTPGFAASDTDSDRAMEAFRDAEILIYCSTAAGCFNQEDQVRVNHALASLPCPETTDPQFPPLGNFLFVITHAGPQVTDSQLLKIQQGVSHQFYRSFGDGLLKRRLNGIQQPPPENKVAARFVPFWGELESRHRDMRQNILTLLREDFPHYRMILADRTIEEFRQTALSANRGKIDEWKAFLNKWEQSKLRVQETEQNEPKRKEWVIEQAQLIQATIEQYKRDSVANFENHYSELINVDTVERIIRERYASQDDAKSEIGAFLLKDIQEKVAKDLDQRSKLLANEINNFLKGFASGGGQFLGFGFQVDATPGFNAVASFAGGLAGLTTFGALAVWATLLGNLGGYILVAKVVGLLAAIGIPTGGVATVITAIAAFGGPIVLAIAIAILAAISAILFFWKSWQRRMAEKVCGDFANQNLRAKIREQIERYWNDTLEAFRTATAAVERDWLAYLDDLKKIVNADSKDAIDVRIQALERLHDFFVRLPWFQFRQMLGRSEGVNNA